MCVSGLTIDVGNLILLQDRLGLRDHDMVGLGVGPFEPRLLQLALQYLHEAVGVRVVVDAVASRTKTQAERVRTLMLLLAQHASMWCGGILLFKSLRSEEFVLFCLFC